MNIGYLESIFSFLGGLGMFLYGMSIMGDGMQKSAGSKLNKFLRMVTDNRLLAVGLGALITAILHSSGATTVMVVGFVNAGILNLTQAVGVIMGANIGTTITAWMVSLNSLGDAMKVLQPSFFAPLVVAIGAAFLMFSKKKKESLAGEICIGVGLLFVGLTFMSGSVAPYTDAPIFAKAFAVLGRNPILGILVGALVTAIIQSSTASVGILQTLAMSGVVSANAAIYITLGQNIGSCLTALLSSAGTSRNAKRASVIHLTFNSFGAIVFGIGMYIISMMRPDIAQSSINSFQISVFHTFFNVTNTLLLFPFAKQLVAFSGLIVRETGEEEEKKGLFGLFKKTGSKLEAMKAQYAKVESNVDKIARELEQHQVTLLKDVAMFDQMYELNLKYYKELTMYILAGKKKLEDMRAGELPALKAKAEQSGAQEDAQAYNDMVQMCERFEKKLHDLELTRMISVQMGPQTRLLQNNDTLMVEKIQSSLVNTIPLWKSQMVLALGLEHGRQATAAQSAVTEMTNELLKKNADLLKMGTIETAKEAERSVVDIETLQHTNQQLISTLDGVLNIQREGAQKRRAAEAELGRIEGELKQKLLELRN